MFAKFLVAPVLALGLACLAAPAVGGAQQTMSSMSDCSTDAMHAKMMKMTTEAQSMKSSGSMDKDYAMMMEKMTKDAHAMSMWEMKCGKDAKMMGWAKKNATMFMSLSTQLQEALAGGA